MSSGWMARSTPQESDVDEFVGEVGHADGPTGRLNRPSPRGPTRIGRRSSQPDSARRTARARRTGEGLGYGDPLGRQVAHDLETGVGHVAPLGHHQTEVEGRPSDPVDRGAPSPPTSAPTSHCHSVAVGRRQPARRCDRPGPPSPGPCRRMAGPARPVGDVARDVRWEHARLRGHHTRPGRGPTSPSAGPRRTTALPWVARTREPGPTGRLSRRRRPWPGGHRPTRRGARPRPWPDPGPGGPPSDPG